MKHKQSPLIKQSWEKLQELVLPIAESDLYELLEALKSWMELYQKIFSATLLESAPVLSLLLKGQIAQFHLVKPMAGKNMKYLINSDFYIPKNQKDVVECLEAIVCEFALFTNWEDCPRCNEGYLEYWKNTNINKIILSCPECGWEQYLNKELEEYDLEPANLVPASKEDIKILDILIRKKKNM